MSCVTSCVKGLYFYSPCTSYAVCPKKNVLLFEVACSNLDAPNESILCYFSEQICNACMEIFCCYVLRILGLSLGGQRKFISHEIRICGTCLHNRGGGNRQKIDAFRPFGDFLPLLPRVTHRGNPGSLY